MPVKKWNKITPGSGGDVGGMTKDKPPAEYAKFGQDLKALHGRAVKLHAMAKAEYEVFVKKAKPGYNYDTSEFASHYPALAGVVELLADAMRYTKPLG